MYKMIFHDLAPAWYKQWDMIENYKGGSPYEEKPDEERIYFVPKSICDIITENEEKKVVWKYQRTYTCPPDCGGEEFDEYGFIPYCPKCDIELNEFPQQKYCMECGTKLKYDKK